MPQSPTSNGNECLCVRLQIINKYITNSLAVYTPKSDFKWQLVFVCLT